MRTLVLVIAVLLGTSSSASAHENCATCHVESTAKKPPDPCKDLYELSCRSESIPDPTGEVSDEDFNSIVTNKFAVIKTKLNPYLMNSIKRNKVLSSTFLNDDAHLLFLYIVHNKTVFELSSSDQAKIENLDLDKVEELNQSSVYRKIEKRVVKEIHKNTDQKIIQRKISRKIFPEIRNLLSSMAPDSAIRKTIKKMRYGGNCDSLEWDERPASLKKNAYYRDGSRSLYLCAGYLLKTKSEFAIVHTLTHEMAHSFAPCKLARKNSNFKKSIGTTLQDPESIYAFNSILECLQKKATDNKQSGNKILEACKKNPQFDEAFADWIAAEATSRWVESQARHYQWTPSQIQAGYANAFRGICARKDYPFSPRDKHPSDKTRINRILMSHPRVRAQMGCHPDTLKDPNHCSFDFPKP